MKPTASFVACLVAVALGSAPLSAAPLDGQGKKKDPPKPEKKKDEHKKPEEKKPESPRGLKVGAELDGATSLEDASGKPHTLKEYRGKIVVLDLWSTSSASDAQEKRLQRLASEYAAKNVVVLGVDSVAGETVDGKKVLDVATKSGASFPVLLDKGGILAERLGAKALDEIFVLDAKGVLRYAGAIDDDPKGEKADKAQDYLGNALKALTDGKEIPTATTEPNGPALRVDRKPAGR